MISIPHKVKNMNSLSICLQYLSQIEKDLPRTQIPSNVSDTVSYQNHLKEVLIYFCSQNPSIGYIQGMNIIVSAIAAHSSDVVQTKMVFNYLMTHKLFEAIYEGDLSLGEKLARHLSEELGRFSKKLFLHFVISKIFRWLIKLS